MINCTHKTQDFNSQDISRLFSEEPNVQENLSFPLLVPAIVDVSLEILNRNEKEFYSEMETLHDLTGNQICLSKIIDFFIENNLLEHHGSLYFWDGIQNFIYFSHTQNLSELWVPATIIHNITPRNIIYLRFVFDELNETHVYNNSFQNSQKQEATNFTSDAANLERYCEKMIGQSLQQTSSDFTIKDEELSKEMTENPSYLSKRRRHRERTISEAVNLVGRWRKLYNGVANFNQVEFVKCSLKEAAQKIGVPKKSLDDYLLIINQARNLNFDFQAMKNERFGVLRSFVKMNKSKLIQRKRGVSTDFHE